MDKKFKLISSNLKDEEISPAKMFNPNFLKKSYYMIFIHKNMNLNNLQGETDLSFRLSMQIKS